MDHRPNPAVPLIYMSTHSGLDWDYFRKQVAIWGADHANILQVSRPSSPSTIESDD